MKSEMELTLYERLGKEGISKLLDSFYDRVFNDPSIAPLFANSTRSEIQEKQRLFISQFLGGPMGYTENFGPPKMRQRHIPHRITPLAKDAWLKCMKEAIDEQDWDERLKEVMYSIFPPIAAHMVNSED